MAKSSTRRVILYINCKEVVQFGFRKTEKTTTEMEEQKIKQRKNTRRHARYAEPHHVPPLKGHQKNRAAAVSCRAVVPAGHGGRGVALFYRASAPVGHGSHGVSPSYRALGPGGAGLPSGIEGHRSDATANYSLLTANSSHTFSAKEKDVETGLSYFGSRYYSSDLSIWLSVDPMSDKYASLSPYTYCANNPVKLVDPNGEEIDPESLSLWNTMRSSLNNEKFSARIGMLIEKATHGILCEGASNRYMAIDRTLTTMETMEGSSQVYKLSRCKGAVSSVRYDKKDNSLTVNFSSTSGFIHEITHCGQFEKGWIGFSRKSGLVFSDIFDELEAYRNQSWYDPSSLPFVSAINPFSEDWVRNIYDGKKYPYKKCGLFPTNRDSTMEDIRKAYPGLNWTFSGTISNAYKKLFYFKPKSVTEKS